LGDAPRLVVSVVEQLMFDWRGVLPAHTEADRIPHVIHDGCDVSPHVARIRVGEHRLVAAADVIPDAGWAH
jgi:hypothetical protein